MTRHRLIGIARATRQWFPQAAVLVLFGLAIAWLGNNLLDNLTRRGITVGFDFLDRAARFPISESILSYTPTNSFGWAFVVGLGNTLFISAIVIALSTALGLAMAWHDERSTLWRVSLRRRW